MKTFFFFKLIQMDRIYVLKKSSKDYSTWTNVEKKVTLYAKHMDIVQNT